MLQIDTKTAPTTHQAAAGRDAALANLRALERRRLAAMRSNDAKALDALLAADMVYVHESGHLYHRDDYIRAIDSHALTYREDIELVEEEATVSDGVLIAFGVMRGHALLEGEQQVFNLRYVATWLLANGGWRLAVVQKTPIQLDGRPHEHGDF